MSNGRKPIPVMLTGQALTSLRESGFSFPAAVGEIIDNSVEARANKIDVIIDEAQSGRKKVVGEIIVVDDGIGMDDETLQHYLQFGFSTRFMSTKTIGKFGVGAKLAGLSVGQRIEAWSRVEGSDRIRHVVFDLEEANDAEAQGEEVSINPPDEEPLPGHLEHYFPESSGTLVRWSKIDRVADSSGRSTPNHVRVELQKEISRIFREFLCGGIRMTIDGTELLPHDPTFQRKGTWADRVLLEAEVRAGQEESVTTERHFDGQVFYDKRVPVKGSDETIRVVITLAPKAAIQPRGHGGNDMARKLRIPDNQGAISFMRLDREISYTNVPKLFPGGVQDADRYIGFEVYFTPELDRMMGVRNVKRGAEPEEGLRATLREIAESWIPQAREELDRIWGEKSRSSGAKAGENARMAKAVQNVDRTMPKSRVKDASTPEERQMELEDLAHDVGLDTPEEKAAYIEEVKELPFVIETVSMAGEQLFDLTHYEHQTIIRLNSRHVFYRTMYEPLSALSSNAAVAGGAKNAQTARRAIEAITLLLVAYAKAEAQHPSPKEQYGELRQWWGMFTERFVSKIKDVL